MRYVSAVLVFVFIFISCEKRKEELIGNYTIEAVFDEELYKELELLAENVGEDVAALSSSSEKRFSFLSLEKDGSFSMLVDTLFFAGSYFKEDNSLILKNSFNGEKFNFDIKLVSLGNFQLKGDCVKEISVNKTSSCVINLSKINDSISDRTDVFSVLVNTWRFKAKEPETYDEIKNRVIGNLNYISNYLRFHGESNSTVINVKSIESPFRYASNGVALKPFNEVPTSWLNLFYNEYEAKQAYDLLEVAFRKDIAIPTNVNSWPILNSIILSQLKILVKKE